MSARARPPRSKFKLLLLVLAFTGIGSYLLLATFFYLGQDALIYPAPHGEPPAGWVAWTENNELAGYTRPATDAEHPRAVWLVFQGNGSSAGPRGYFEVVPADEAIFILEYPGYGARPGRAREDSINAAALAGYQALRHRFPGVPLGVVGESFGSGPACALTRAQPAPNSLTLLVPLADFREAIGHMMPLPFARYLVRDQWDNRAALRDYRGPITLYAAEADEVLPRAQTESLAACNPAAKLIWLPGGHVAPGNGRLVELPR